MALETPVTMQPSASYNVSLNRIILLTVLASKKGQGIGKARIIGLAAGGSRELPALLLHHLEMFWDERSETPVKGGSQLTTLQQAQWHQMSRCQDLYNLDHIVLSKVVIVALLHYKITHICNFGLN